MKIKALLFLPFLFLFFYNLSAQEQLPQDSIINLRPGMTNAKLNEIIKREAKIMESNNNGVWQVLYGERLLYIMTDETNNRMRIFTPVIAKEEIKEGEGEKMLEANFHSALDAKYSLYEGFVITVYTHPLRELQPRQFIDAMQQVAVLADNYGDTYSSTTLIFGGGQEKEKTEEKKLNKKPGKKRGSSP